MSQVDEVRAAADIVKIVGEYVKLRKAGANLMGLCPFHQEKTPSFAVHPFKQIFHCFGCGVGGDVFKFVMLIDNCSFPEALGRVAEKVGIRVREGAGGADTAASRERGALYKIHEVAAKFFAAQLGGSSEGRAARAYLADRGLTDQVVGRFRLGYAPSDGNALTRHLTEAGFSLDLLLKSGLVLRDAEGKRHPYDRFRRRVIFPIANESGKVIAFGGRALGDDQPKYLNSPETPIYIKGRVLYHLDGAAGPIRKLDYAVLVEGYMDCIAVASRGVENVVASCGTNLTDSQVRLLSRYARRVVVNYDPDSAGMAAAERSLVLLLEEGFEVKVLVLPGGLDPDAFIRERGADAYRERLATTPSYLDYVTERAASQHDLTRPEGKIAAANAILPYLARVPNPMLRAELANRLADRLRIDQALLQEELKRAAIKGEREVRAGVQPATSVSPAERQLMRVFLESEQLADEFLPKLVEEGVCEGLPSEGLFKRLFDVRRRGEKIEVSQLQESLASEEQRWFYDALFASAEVIDRDAALACVKALKRRKAEREREKLQAEIRLAEREQNHGRVAELLNAKVKLAKELAALRRG